MNFSTATTLNAKANAAVDNLYERGLLPVPSGMTAEGVRDILDGSDREHDLRPDEVAVLACSALNPHPNKRQARAVNEAIVDLTGAKPKLEERTQLAAEVALRGFPADKRLTALRSSLDRAWRWSVLRGVELTRSSPLDLLPEALRELVQAGEGAGPAIAELAALASYHLVGGRTQTADPFRVRRPRQQHRAPADHAAAGQDRRRPAAAVPDRSGRPGGPGPAGAG
ncbi:hypothetical protein [Streptomyces sp. NPDC051993]|uniref:hypothetical protein n=1 Tax=Streptomyces sp. NPDC051993 TaxID=3155286 RepID=UPI003431E617